MKQSCITGEPGRRRGSRRPHEARKDPDQGGAAPPTGGIDCGGMAPTSASAVPSLVDDRDRDVGGPSDAATHDVGSSGAPRWVAPRYW